MAHVGGRIRTLRAERQMTLDDLAKKSGLSKGLLSKLENLTDSNPSIETLYKIAEAFGVTLSDLLESGKVQAKRVVPDKTPAWVDAIVTALKPEGKKPDEDILQALYVLQMRKGSAQKNDTAWVYMYKSLELNFSKSRA
jgi:transcriptional regulator with XRE-family HTH domain